MPFDAVLFDLDETLITRTQDVGAVYRAAFERVGIERFGEPTDLWPLLDGAPDPDDQVGYLAAGFARLAAQHGRRDVDPVALSDAFVSGVDNSQVAFTEDAERVLAAARDAGPVGIVTNGPAHRQQEKVTAVALDDRVDTIVYAGDLARRKPHADPFEQALSALGVGPANVLYVGDSLSYDVAGAHNAGLQAGWLANGDGPDPYRPEFVLDSLADLLEHL